jgi:hypothetical protein
MAGKIIRFPGKHRREEAGPLTGRLRRFLTEEYHIGRREKHTQRRYVPAAMTLSLVTTSRWTDPLPRPQRKGGGRLRRRSPSTLQLNNSNVKRKPKARGRTK